MSEESRERLLKGLKESTSNVRNNTFVIIGAAGSGKTSTMALMMGRDPPQTRTSTGCTTCPVRGMTTTRISKSGQRWEIISLQSLSQQLATTARAVAMRRAGSEIVAQIKCVSAISTESPSSGVPSQTQAQQESVDSETTSLFPPAIRHSVNTGPFQFTQISSDTVESLGSMLEVGVFNRTAELLDMEWVSLLDSGGQPAFHELFPLFVHNPSAALFTLKLSEPLSSHYMVSYWKEGKQVGKPYCSSLNNEQILSSCIRSISSQAPSDETMVDQSKEERDAGRSREGEGRREKKTKLAFIGTHRDLESTCTDETRAEKENKLSAMIPPSFRSHVLRCGRLNELIFAVNAKTPEGIDKETMAHLQQELVENSSAEWQQIPTSYYAIDLALQTLAEKLGRRVLSKEECKQEAEKLDMEEKTMMAALRHLHNLNILFYYDDEMALPGLVFMNGQVLLDKITELVEKSHQLRENSSCGVAIGGEWERFGSHAIVTRQQLEGFGRHYQEGLFSVDHLIKLFTFKPILAPIGQDRFLIPAILPAEDKERLASLVGESKAYLLFFFPHGIPFGVFCALNANVINHSGWSLLERRGWPVQVSRNCISYTLPDNEPGKVSLVDTHSDYIAAVVEVRANSKTLASKICQKLCPKVRDTVSSNISRAAGALHYSNMIPLFGFLCPGTECSTSPHAGIISSDHSSLTCSLERDVIHSLTNQQHRFWLSDLKALSLPPSPGWPVTFVFYCIYVLSGHLQLQEWRKSQHSLSCRSC